MGFICWFGLFCSLFYENQLNLGRFGVLPDGVVHARHGEVGGQVGGVGRAHDEGEEPPAAHDDTQRHRSQDGVAAWGDTNRGARHR